jgi:inhibitor of KinA
MNGPAFTIRPQGDRCLSLDFGQDIRAETGLMCLSAAATLRAAALAGVSDIVPSYTAVALFYSPGTQEQPVTFASLSREVKRVLSGPLLAANASSRLIKIPVCYGGVHGPDLSDVAKRTGLTEEEVVAKHGASDTMVFSLGFSPGHPYIGIHDEIFAIPRRDVPRTVVPRGSVAIANRQSTIYPERLPGGWHILGATPLRLFDLAREQPSLLLPGDKIEFVPIDQNEFDRLAAKIDGKRP